MSTGGSFVTDYYGMELRRLRELLHQSRTDPGPFRAKIQRDLRRERGFPVPFTLILTVLVRKQAELERRIQEIEHFLMYKLGS